MPEATGVIIIGTAGSGAGVGGGFGVVDVDGAGSGFVDDVGVFDSLDVPGLLSEPDPELLPEVVVSVEVEPGSVLVEFELEWDPELLSDELGSTELEPAETEPVEVESEEPESESDGVELELPGPLELGNSTGSLTQEAKIYNSIRHIKQIDTFFFIIGLFYRYL